MPCTYNLQEKRVADEAKRKIDDEKRRVDEKLRAEEDAFAKKVAKSRIYIKMFALQKGERRRASCAHR